MEGNPKFPLPPCRVCDAPGTGFHYGVNTCEACKGFFHRSLKKWKTYKCMNSGECPIQHGRGILCRHCRYKRCLVMGMSKTAIKVGRYNYKKKTNDILEVKKITEQSRRMAAGEFKMEADSGYVTRSFESDHLVAVKIEEDIDDIIDLTHSADGRFTTEMNYVDGNAYYSKNANDVGTMDWARQNRKRAYDHLTTTNDNYYHTKKPSLDSPPYPTTTTTSTKGYHSYPSPTSSSSSSPMSPPFLSSCHDQWSMTHLENLRSGETDLRSTTSSSSPYYPQSVDDGYVSSETPTPSIVSSSSSSSSSSLSSSSNSIHHDASATIKTESPSQQMPPLWFFPPSSSNENIKRSNPCGNGNGCPPPPKAPPSPYCNPSSTIEETRDDTGYGESSDESVQLPPSTLKNLLLRGKSSTNNTPFDPGTTAAASRCYNAISDIEMMFQDYESVIRSLVEAHDVYVLPYFRSLSEEETRMHQKTNDASNQQGDSGNMGTGMADIELTMEDTIRVMVSFAMAIPGFIELQKDFKIDLIKNSRQEFCLLNLFPYVNSNPAISRQTSGQDTRHISPTETSIDKHLNCLDAIFSFMTKFQHLGMTLEERVVLRALAIMAPDRVSQVNSSTLPVIYDQLVNVLIYQLSKRFASPLLFFAKIMSLVTECRTQEEELTTKFKTLNPISFQTLNDKPFLKLMYSWIYS